MTDMSQASERGREWLAEVLRRGGISAEIATAEVNGEMWLTIEPTDRHEEIAKSLCSPVDRPLDALQYLANATLNLEVDRELQCSYTLEIDGYRRAREAELQALVESTVARVRETGEALDISGLTAAERRTVHHLLQDYPDLTNHSHGQEPHRKLAVELANADAKSTDDRPAHPPVPGPQTPDPAPADPAPPAP